MKKLNNKNLKELKGDNDLKDYIIDYLLDNYDQADERESFIKDLLSHGCVSGMVSGLIYYDDTNKFHDDYENEIWQLASDQMESFGEYDNIIAFIGSFNGAKNVNDQSQFKNLLAWYGFEEMARIIYEQDLDNQF